MTCEFDALGDATRRRILEWLVDGEQSVGAIVAGLNRSMSISQPAVSQHLRVLRDAGLVQVRAQGTTRFHSLDAEGLEAARTWLARLVEPVEPFAQQLDALATEVARGTRDRRRRGGGRVAGATTDERPA